MGDPEAACVVGPVAARDPEVRALLEALTAELAGEGYTAEQTFGYSTKQLEQQGVHLVGARRAGSLVGVAGLEVQAEGFGELKRFFVRPGARGSGIADALLTALLAHAREAGVRLVRLETGDRQQAAQAFYRRHGFRPVPRFGPYVSSETSVCLQRPV